MPRCQIGAWVSLELLLCNETEVLLCLAPIGYGGIFIACQIFLVISYIYFLVVVAVAAAAGAAGAAVALVVIVVVAAAAAAVAAALAFACTPRECVAVADSR